ncbi:MAG: GntR family transcriptional regulator [Thermomicrobiales bacterium]
MSDGTPILRVDLASPVPVYRQIVDQLRILLVSGELKAGDQLPTVRQVAGDLGVHHNTVAEAYRQLAEEGWLDLRRRRGACVVERGRPAADPEAVTDFQRRVQELIADAVARGASPHAVARALHAAGETLEGRGAL